MFSYDNSLGYLYCKLGDKPTVPWWMIEEIVTPTTIVYKDHHRDCNSTESIQRSKENVILFYKKMR